MILQHGEPSKQTQAPEREVLAGLVDRVTFHDTENGFCVLRVKARGHRDLITVVGHAATIAAGERRTHPRVGMDRQPLALPAPG